MAWGINTYNRVPIKRACNGYYLRWWYNGWHYWFFLPGKYTVNTQGENYKTIGTREIAMATGQITRSECDAIRTIMNTREVYLLTVAGWMNIRIEPGSVNVYNNMVAGSEFEFVAIIGSKEITYTTGYSPVPGDGTIPEVPVVPPDIGYCEVIIGTQIWMCKNWDSNYPNSKVYNNNETNRAIYGGLYTYNQVVSPGFCPAGWHVPTEAEWNVLIAYVGGLATGGGELKEIGTTNWNPPNTGAVDTYGFSARGGGDFNRWSLVYEYLLTYGIFWTATEHSSSNAMMIYLSNNSDAIVLITAVKDYYFSVRMIKDTPAPPTIVDIDGNVYHWVTIGIQQWLVENLKATHYADGSPIPNLTLNVDWTAEDGTVGHDGAYCYYNNDIANKADYGALYNWYAVDNARGLAPAGWRVPTDADWVELMNFVGGDVIAAGKLKEMGLAHWDAPNLATNDYGFNCVGGGKRDASGLYEKIKEFAFLWSSSDFDITTAFYEDMKHNETYMEYTNQIAKIQGFSVRCVRDV